MNGPESAAAGSGRGEGLKSPPRAPGVARAGIPAMSVPLDEPAIG